MRKLRSLEKIKFANLVFHLRWMTPLAIALIGVGYILFEHVVLLGYPLTSAHVIRTMLVIGLVGPALAWLILNWVANTVKAEAAAEQQLAFRNRELTTLNAIGEAASQSLDLEKILQAAQEKMIELIGLQAVEIRLVEGGRLILKSHHGVSSDFVSKERAVQLGYCLCGKCALTGQALARDELALEPSMAGSACVMEGFQSTLSIPMKAKGRVVGVVHVASHNKRAFSPIDQQILTTISDRVALAVENARLYEEAQRRAMQLETASLIGQRMTALLDFDSLLAEVVRLIRVRFGYYHTRILLVDEEARELVLKEASGPSAESIKARGLRLKVGEQGITGWVAYTGQTLMCNDVSREPRYDPAELVAETKAELAVPLRVGSRVLGVLDVQSERRDAFGKEDATVLQILGNQIGIAIENARLFQETQRRYDAMAALHETSLDIISQLDVPALLEALLRRGAHLLGAQAGSLYLYDADRNLVRNLAGHNTSRDWTGVTVRPGEGVSGTVVLTGKPLIVNDYDNWPGKADLFTGDRLTRVIGVPLKAQNQTIGAILVSDDSHSRPFDQQDIWLLSQFADLATIAIKNAELHTQVKGLSQELERKVEERTQELSRAKDEIVAKAEQLRALLVKTISIQEEERARIARDMHDGVIQLITASRYELQAAKVVAGSGLARGALDKLNAARQILEEIEKEIRRSIYDLHPPILDAVGLAPAVQKYTNVFEQLSGITCEFQITGSPSRLPQRTEIAVFRIVEEALQNVATHAGARSTSVRLDFQPTALQVTVRDDGQGFDYEHWTQKRNGNHLGLLGMQERVVSLGGKMEVWSEPEHGTRVEFRLPLP